MENIEVERLFDRFYRGDKSRSSENGSGGIGLAVAEAITEAHGGEISAHIEDGKAIVFTVVLSKR